MILALRQVSFIQTSSVWLKLLQYVDTFKQAKAYAHSQARARWRAQSLNITIHQLLHYCRLRQCYSVPFRLVIYTSFSSDFDGFSYLPKHSVTVVNPSYIHHIVWDYPVWQSLPFTTFTVCLPMEFLNSRLATTFSLIDGFLTSPDTAHYLNYVLRFLSHLCKRKPRNVGPLSAQERHLALQGWIKNCQTLTYSDEIANLTSKSRSRLPLVRQLRLFLDSDGLLRCGGRIHNAPLDDSAKFPFLLPPRHQLSKLIIHDVNHTVNPHLLFWKLC